MADLLKMNTYMFTVKKMCVTQTPSMNRAAEQRRKAAKIFFAHIVWRLQLLYPAQVN